MTPTRKPTNEQKALAKSLDSAAVKLLAAWRPPNDVAHRFEHTGWMLLRAGIACLEHGDRAFALAADWCARGFPAGSDDPPSRRGMDPDALTSVEAAAEQSDEWEKQRDQLAMLRLWLDDNARDIESRISYTVRVLDNEGRRDSLIDCANPHCDTTMTGLGEDRPKNGRCPRCYQFRYRNNRDWTPNGLDIIASIGTTADYDSLSQSLATIGTTDPRD